MPMDGCGSGGPSLSVTDLGCPSGRVPVEWSRGEEGMKAPRSILRALPTLGHFNWLRLLPQWGVPTFASLYKRQDLGSA